MCGAGSVQNAAPRARSRWSTSRARTNSRSKPDRNGRVSLYFLVFLSVVLGIIFALGFVYAAKTNQFKNVEEPKYQMLRDEE